MRSLSKKRFLVGLFTLVAGLLLTGCASGYQQVDGRWVFVTWNESSGRVDIPVPDVDGASFNPFDKSEYARDAVRVYYRAVPIEGADATTFRHMRGGYWQDRNRVYFFAKAHPRLGPEDVSLPATRVLGARCWQRLRWRRPRQSQGSGHFPVAQRELGQRCKVLLPGQIRPVHPDCGIGLPIVPGAQRRLGKRPRSRLLLRASRRGGRSSYLHRAQRSAREGRRLLLSDRFPPAHRAGGRCTAAAAGEMTYPGNCVNSTRWPSGS